MSVPMKTMLGAVVLVLLVAVTAGALSINRSRTAEAGSITVTAPATLGGAPRVRLAGQPDRSGPDTVDGTWGDFGSRDVAFVLARAYGDPVPDKESDFTRSVAGIFGADDLRETTPGPLGGRAKCGAGRLMAEPLVLKGERLAVCVWADEGSAGYIARTQVSVDTAALEFPRLRAELEKRT